MGSDNGKVNGVKATEAFRNQARVKAEEQERANRVRDKIAAILEKEKCALGASPAIQDGKIVAFATITAMPLEVKA